MYVRVSKESDMPSRERWCFCLWIELPCQFQVIGSRRDWAGGKTIRHVTVSEGCWAEILGTNKRHGSSSETNVPLAFRSFTGTLL